MKNKGAAVKFLKLVVAGKIDEAYKKYVDMDGVHHNAYVQAGFPALQKAMKENHLEFPRKKYKLKNILCEGDLVAAHSSIKLGPKGPDLAVVHIMRFEKGKIAEFWDCGQQLPKKSPNRDGAF